MKRLLFLLALGVGGALLFRTFVYESIYLASDSMAPSLPQGREVFVNKFAFFFRKPQRGEIVMFHAPQHPGKGLVKRVIAIEGDSIEVIKKKVKLNGKFLDEPYIQNVQPQTLFKGDTLPPITIPNGYVFVMGDNRDVSGDSRDWKAPDGTWCPYIPLNSIEGLIKVE